MMHLLVANVTLKRTVILCTHIHLKFIETKQSRITPKVTSHRSDRVVRLCTIQVEVLHIHRQFSAVNP